MTMDTEQSPSATWDVMTDKQKIEWLGEFADMQPWAVDDGWNPLTDWNHWRQVEEKVMENDRLLYKYIQFFWNKQEQWGQKFVKADLPTRAKALFLTLNAK